MSNASSFQENSTISTSGGNCKDISATCNDTTITSLNIETTTTSSTTSKRTFAVVENSNSSPKIDQIPSEGKTEAIVFDFGIAPSRTTSEPPVFVFGNASSPTATTAATVPTCSIANEGTNPSASVIPRKTMLRRIRGPKKMAPRVSPHNKPAAATASPECGASVTNTSMDSPAQSQGLSEFPVFTFGTPPRTEPRSSSETETPSIPCMFGPTDPVSASETTVMTNPGSSETAAAESESSRNDSENVTDLFPICDDTTPVPDETPPNNERQEQPSTSADDTVQKLLRDNDDRSKWIFKEPQVWTTVNVSMRPQQSLQEQLLDAAYHGQLETVRELVHAGVNCRDTSGRTPLFHACEQGHTNVIQLLLQHDGAELIIKNCDGDTPLHSLCRRNDLASMEHLFDSGKWLDVDAVNNRGEKPLDCALINNHIQAVERLLIRGANFSRKYKDGSTPLYWACKYVMVDMVRFILAKKGVDINAQTNGETPLHVACKLGAADIVKLLLEHGANVNVASHSAGITPLEFACRRDCSMHCFRVITGTLMEHGAEVNIQDRISGCTPLHRACEHGLSDIAHALLQKGAKVDAQDKTGTSPLHMAMKLSNVSLVVWLVRRGADLYLPNNNGITPMDIAWGNNFPIPLLFDTLNLQETQSTNHRLDQVEGHLNKMASASDMVNKSFEQSAQREATLNERILRLEGTVMSLKSDMDLLRHQSNQQQEEIQLLRKLRTEDVSHSLRSVGGYICDYKNIEGQLRNREARDNSDPLQEEMTRQQQQKDIIIHQQGLAPKIVRPEAVREFLTPMPEDDVIPKPQSSVYESSDCKNHGGRRSYDESQNITDSVQRENVERQIKQFVNHGRQPEIMHPHEVIELINPKSVAIITESDWMVHMRKNLQRLNI